MRFIDLTGQTFGDWTVLEYVGDRYWKCVCSCGMVRNIAGNQLRDGKSKSCGHNTTAFKDITGEQYGEWLVLKYLGKGYYECECECGTIRKVSAFHLRSGRTQSCGHGQTGYASGHYDTSKRGEIEDLRGQKFGDWTAISYAGKSMWNCVCSCGEGRVVVKADLKSGKSKSCGHNSCKPKVDLSGQRFRHLTILEYVGDGTYKCSCDCGAIKNIRISGIVQGSTTSCGCNKESQRTKYTAEYISKAIDKFELINKRKPFIVEIAELLEISTGYAYVLIRDNSLEYLINREFRSRYELEINTYLRSVQKDTKIIVGDKTILSGYELDLYIPERKLAIEFNGSYWHSEQFKGSRYHQNKTIKAAKKGIQLLHIFEYEWVDAVKHKILKNTIKSKILSENSNKIIASNCDIKEVSTEDEIEFEGEHHLFGYSESKVAYGLYHGEELVSMLTFGKPRLDKDFEWEIIRYCTNIEKEVISGAERLFKLFIDLHEPKSVVAYCDISKFTGGVYERMGFTTSVEGITEPDYNWVVCDRSSNLVLNKYKTKFERLIEEGYGDYGKTEDEIMTNRGFVKVYDCGNLRFTWKNK